MSTKEKGDKLEDEVFEMFNELLDNDEFYLNRPNSKVFKKKKYYSNDRDDYIELDVTIESYFSSSDSYSNLHIIECKNLNKNVTPDDIEELESKINQIGRHSTKGILVSSKGFSKTTIKLAKSWGIGLLLLKSNKKTDWINYRKETTPLKFTEHSKEPIIALIYGKVVNNFADILLDIGAIDTYRHSEKYIKVPYVSEEKIEEIVQRLYRYDIHDGHVLNLDKLQDFLESKYDLNIKFSKLEEDILGKIEFNPLKISISSNQEENRKRFTFCHEVGHLILHKKLLEDKIDNKTDTQSSLTLGFQATNMSTKRLEIQANIFASHLLIPSEPLIRDVAKYFDGENINKGYLYLDKQPVNISLVNTLLRKLSDKYGASMEAIRIKLISLNLLRDESSITFRKFLKMYYS